MFLDFAGMLINTNYIIRIYKSMDYYNENKLNKLLKSQTITMICNNITETCVYKEYYNNEKERNKRFNEIISMINNK
jgi:hypothetical protein